MYAGWGEDGEEAAGEIRSAECEMGNGSNLELNESLWVSVLPTLRAAGLSWVGVLLCRARCIKSLLSYVLLQLKCRCDKARVSPPVLILYLDAWAEGHTRLGDSGQRVPAVWEGAA